MQNIQPAPRFLLLIFVRVTSQLGSAPAGPVAAQHEPDNGFSIKSSKKSEGKAHYYPSHVISHLVEKTMTT